MIAWDQLIGTTVAVAGVIVPMLLKVAHDRRKQHEENQTKLNALLSEREYLTPHDHIEDAGPLMESGIIRRRKVNGGR